MTYDFDRVIDRTNTDSLKYDFARQRGKPEGILPLWVADMDFQAPPCVLDALAERSRHGIFGYSDTGEDYAAVLQDWFWRRFRWRIEPDWIVKTPGVVTALHIAVQAFTAPGDGIIIQQPVYYPFSAAVRTTGRTLVVSELVLQDGRYQIDFADFEAKVKAGRVTLFILCSPHNPVGRVWTEEELTKLGDICLRHGVRVVSDEIHADFVFPGRRHRVFADLSPALRDITITCTAPSKTFNLAGLQISNILIADPRLRAAFARAYAAAGLSQLGIMGLVACRAAYAGGEAWLEALKVYLTGSLALLRDTLARTLPAVRLIEPEGTYLAWLDCRALGLTPAELDDRIVRRAGLWLDEGPMFGAGGAGFQRINFACPRSVLTRALTQLGRIDVSEQ
ncbi:MAG: pyridoxal phosphate-dependent aminotransferase [Oscillospiraceae bacterium]|jgi:cystathionine beta-lyase|nr:pyridoxal phosphate-dependent aminotransferase [Oscillospiraceae bacterium]